MGKPLPEHVTRAEAAKALRLSVRQVDRLAEAGKLKKVPLSASRRGFDRRDFDHYLKSLGNGEGYVSPVEALTITLPGVESQSGVNRAAELIDAMLAAQFPGCLASAANGEIQIVWNAALGYTAEQISEALKQ